jgi:hypothetical protein
MNSEMNQTPKPKSCIIVVYLRWRRTCTATGIHPRRPSTLKPVDHHQLFRRTHRM